MEKMTTETAQNLNRQIEEILRAFQPEKMEDIFFDVFNQANVEGLSQKALDDRELLHRLTRQLLRTLSNKPQNLQDVKD